MTWKWVAIKMHGAFRKVYGDSYVPLGVPNPPQIALQPSLPMCRLGRTANAGMQEADNRIYLQNWSFFSLLAAHQTLSTK